MLSISETRLIGVVAIGVFIGNIVSQSRIISMPEYLYSYCDDIYRKYQFNRKYAQYLKDISVNELTNNKLGRNILILCHGRKNPVVHIDLINYDQDVICTMDKDPEISPHIVKDLSQSTCFEIIPDKCIDIIIFHSCDCHTKSIDTHPVLASECYRMLKQNGELWVLEPNENRLWPQDKFNPKSRLYTYQEDKNDSISWVSYSRNGNFYFQV